jgi:phosphoglycolate phosphatase-like HAD superfamily hydrolase
VALGDNMPNVLLTDLDRTLIDSNALHAESTIGFRNKDGNQVVPALTNLLHASSSPTLHGDYISQMVAFPQFRELLLRVLQSGMQIALATSSDKEILRRIPTVGYEYGGQGGALGVCDRATRP